MTSPRSQHSQEPADPRGSPPASRPAKASRPEKLEGDIWLRLVAACVHVDDDEVRADPRGALSYPPAACEATFPTRGLGVEKEVPSRVVAWRRFRAPRPIEPVPSLHQRKPMKNCVPASFCLRLFSS